MKLQDKTSNADNILGTMWVHVKKKDPHSDKITYKSRLVVLGNSQKPDTYEQIKSSNARASTVKLLMAIQAKTNCYSMVMDVKGAYLKVKIPDDHPIIHVKLPEKGKNIYKLNKFLYGMKQAGRMWMNDVTGF